MKKILKQFEKLQKAVIQDEKFIKRYREYFWILQKIKGYKNKRILDAGCGGSPLPFFFAVNQAKVFAVDIKWKFDDPMELAFYCLFSLYPQYNLTFINSDLTDTPFKNNYFDYITCTSVFQTMKIKKWMKVMSELIRILKGHLLITVNYEYTKEDFPVNYKGLNLITRKKEKTLEIFIYNREIKKINK